MGSQQDALCYYLNPPLYPVDGGVIRLTSFPRRLQLESPYLWILEYLGRLLYHVKVVQMDHALSRPVQVDRCFIAMRKYPHCKTTQLWDLRFVDRDGFSCRLFLAPSTEK